MNDSRFRLCLVLLLTGIFGMLVLTYALPPKIRIEVSGGKGRGVDVSAEVYNH
jgi:hypothetical protein